jgi:predicted O-methyltransferase YrrM
MALGAPRRMLARRLNPRLAIRRLAGQGGDATALAVAIDAMRNRRATSEEEAAMRRIEDLRISLAQSDDEIEDVGNRPSAVSRLLPVSTEERWCRLLFALTRQTKPKSCLELGTSLGISAAYLAMALEMNGSGRLLTIEGSLGLADYAARNLAALGLEQRVEVRNGRFREVLGDALEAVAPVDVAYIDGHHQEKATLDYFDQISAHSNPGAIFLFDDISWSPGMRRAWRRIARDQRCAASASLGDVGLCRLSTQV